MIKKILFITILAMFIVSFPAKSSGEPNVEGVELDAEGIVINISESVLHITGANGLTLQIFNVAGISVAQIKIDSADKRVELNLPKGCYILKVGKVVRKISIR